MFIVYPIRRVIAAWVMESFVTADDFTGKAVIPFATSVSSGIGESGELLSAMAGTVNWYKGQKFLSGASTEDIHKWVNGLGV